MGVNLGHSGRLRNRLTLLAVGVTLALSAFVSDVAAAGATISSYAYSNTYTTTDPQDPACDFPFVVVSGTVTEFGHGQIIETARGITIHSEDDMTYQIVFADGSSVEGRAQSHATYNVHGTVTVYTDPVVEPRTYYSPDGEPIGTLIIHYIGHITYDAATGNVTGLVDRFFFTCM